MVPPEIPAPAILISAPDKPLWHQTIRKAPRKMSLTSGWCQKIHFGTRKQLSRARAHEDRSSASMDHRPRVYVQTA